MAALIALYRGVTALAAPLIARRDRARLRAKGVAPDRFCERAGRSAIPRPTGPLIWINAVSVGETLSVLPVVEALVARGAAVVLTTTTETAADLAARRLPQGAVHQFAPLDTPAATRRFLDHWRPDLSVWVESDLWPRQILSAAERNIPLALINARLSERSLRAWGHARSSAGRVFGAFDLVLSQTQATATALTGLGARAPIVTGDLKASAAALPVDAQAAHTLRAAIGGRPHCVGASTHDGEDAALVQAHAEARKSRPGLLLTLVPRHPERGATLEAALTADGWRVARRSTGALPGPQTDIYIADTLGELGLFYAAADLAFIGGSLPPHTGGHNPYEAQHFGTPVVTGPGISSFTSAYEPMIAAGAARMVTGADTLPAAMRDALDSSDWMRRQMEALPKGNPDLPAEVAGKLIALIG